MPGKRKAVVVRREEQITPLTDVISSLDSMRAYRRRAGQNLEAKFERLGGMGYPELRKMWWDIEDDVKRIVEMPLEIPRIPLLIRLNLYLRLVGRIFFILLVVVMASRLVPAWRPYLGPVLGDKLWFLIFVVVGGVAALNGEMVIDYIIRRRIVRYEKETERKYAKNVTSLKNATQKVINQLRREVKAGQRDPSDFTFKLFYTDYDGIEVTSSKVPRSMVLFKRKFQVHTARVTIE